MFLLTVFGYWNPMGFIPNFCIIKIVCSVGIMRIDGGETVGNMKMDAKSRKAMYFTCLI